MNFTKTVLIGLDSMEGMGGYFRVYIGGDGNKSSCLLLDTENLLRNIKVPKK